jgi:hypothetical protein
MDTKIKIAPDRSSLTAIERRRLELFYAYKYNYHTLIRERVKAFDSDGKITVTNTDGSTYKQSGRVMIAQHIRYFEEKDRACYYRLCAELKKVQDEYEMKFGK